LARSVPLETATPTKALLQGEGVVYPVPNESYLPQLPNQLGLVLRA
jgi:hypothetical protein